VGVFYFAFMKFIRKHWSNILIVGVIILLTIPQTRTSLSVFVNKILASTPAEVAPQNQREVTNYYWSLEDRYGARFNFETSKNKVVFINYWATWCPPCIAEMPDLEDLYQKYHTEIDFYFITNDDPLKVEAFMKKNNYNFPVYYSKSNVPTNLESSALPTTYVLSKKGKVVFDKVGAANWNSDRFTTVLDKLIVE